MLLYFSKCRKNTESKNQKNLKDKNGRIMLLWKCTVWHSNKPWFIKKQEVVDF